MKTLFSESCGISAQLQIDFNISATAASTWSVLVRSQKQGSSGQRSHLSVLGRRTSHFPHRRVRPENKGFPPGKQIGDVKKLHLTYST